MIKAIVFAATLATAGAGVVYAQQSGTTRGSTGTTMGMERGTHVIHQFKITLLDREQTLWKRSCWRKWSGNRSQQSPPLKRRSDSKAFRLQHS